MEISVKTVQKDAKLQKIAMLLLHGDSGGYDDGDYDGGLNSFHPTGLSDSTLKESFVLFAYGIYTSLWCLLWKFFGPMYMM